MANDKDFIVKNAVQVGGDTKVTLGSSSAGSVSNGYDISAASYDSVSFYLGNQLTAASPTSIAFNETGTKLFILEQSGLAYQYSLSTAWDVSTASYDSVSFDPTQSAFPYALEFANSGSKMYIFDYYGTVYEYSLSSAFDLSTASYSSNSYSSSEINGQAQGILFNPNGTKVYLLSANQDAVFQYSLSTAYDISTASYDSKSLDVSSEEGTAFEMSFNNTGTKLFVLGRVNDSVFQYNLSTAYDISTASYSGISFDVSTQEDTPYGLAFKPDGTKMYISGNTNETVYQYSTSATTTTANLDLSTGNYFSHTPTSDLQYTFSNPADVQSFQLEVNYQVSTSGDLLFFAADAGNSSNYDDADGWTTIIDIANQTTPDTNFYLVRQTAASDGSYDISFATNNDNALPSGGAFMCTNGATYQGVSNGTGTVSFASGLTVGESVLFLVESGDNSNTTYTPPSGYTVLFESTGTETTLTHTVVSYKIADATSESTSGGTFSAGNVYRALIHVRNAGTAATANDIVAQVQKADAVTSTFTVDGGQVAYTYSQPTITWSSAIQWAGGTAPDAPALGEKDTYTFMTDDTGTSYIGFQSGDAFS